MVKPPAKWVIEGFHRFLIEGLLSFDHASSGFTLRQCQGQDSAWLKRPSKSVSEALKACPRNACVQDQCCRQARAEELMKHDASDPRGSFHIAPHAMSVGTHANES